MAPRQWRQTTRVHLQSTRRLKCLHVVFSTAWTLTNETVRSITGCSPGVSERVKSSSGTWLGQPRRKTITVSSPPHCDRHLTGGDPWGVQKPPGWERSTMTFSPRTLESTRREGRQGTGRSGNKSSVRQRSVRSTLPRRWTCVRRGGAPWAPWRAGK